ncbi:MAG TPA: glycoside hydrolase family 2 [Planctomycetaceae bacterium]|nr:glycoside hydrolase family 2 [Planctomycetaceae bacterium]
MMLLLLLVLPASAQEIVDEWRFAIRRPAEGWQQPEFDDSEWKEASGGFGTQGTPGARIGTTWATNSIWLRKSFELESVPAKPALLLHHDENAEIYINGKRIANLSGFTAKYIVVPIDQSKRSVLRPGRNTMAVRCRQTTGGQFIDVHLVDADNVPTLPKPKRSTKPFESKLITRWGAEVTAENAWTEYPRPRLRRDNWVNLNGRWDYAVTSIDVTETPADWFGEILVPFSLESKLGGVQRLLDASEALWYRRSLELKDKPADRKWLLNFEAVDYRCEVFVNGQSVGTHVGGNDPFSFDITHAVEEGSNELVVRVEDATEGYQLRGKQVINARGIWYTQVSGIWQTVWLEEVPAEHIKDVKVSTSAESGTITVETKTNSNNTVEVLVRDGESTVAKVRGGKSAIIRLNNAKLWSPRNPHLYDITVNLIGSEEKPVDSVTTYAGVRDVGKVQDADGHWRFTLNGKTLFHWGPLDQGWWPDGLMTPPSDEAMLFDIQWLKDAGFNMIRKHIKVEPRRYYYHCDRLGMMVWQDQVSGGVGNQAWPQWSRLKPNPVDAKWPPKQHQQFMLELDRMITSLESHPSIVSWVPFNERWGQHKTMEVGRWTIDRDPSRIINIASGGNFWPVGDVVDAHKYPHPEFPFEDGKGGRFDNYIKVMGEFGGHGFPVPGHLWDANRRNWGYGDIPKSQAEYKQRYTTSLQLLNELRGQGIAGGVYTQTTDVEGEINGLMTYDREVIKIPAKELAELHTVLFTETEQQAARADQFKKEAFIEVATDRKPGPVMSPEAIHSGLKSHDRALYIKAGWIRDPYITLGPDSYYYLTGTQPNEGDPREAENPYNIGLGDASIVGDQVRLWRSKDLVEWESIGPIFSSRDILQKRKGKKNAGRIWAPEVHWLADKGRWALVHCPKQVSSLALTEGADLKGPWFHPMGNKIGQRHDPSIFTDEDGTRYLLWGNTYVAPLSDDLTRYTAEPVRIDPSGSRLGPNGKQINRIGHEGATMIKVGDKYVHLGTAWSTDQGRKGSYNLYYSVADKITGPYGPRKFAGRFLGHGTPFQDRNGNWWCTAFFNANVPPEEREGIQERNIGDNARTINEQGVTIVPLDVRTLANGEVYIRAKDPAYASPGPDEAQEFAQ